MKFVGKNWFRFRIPINAELEKLVFPDVNIYFNARD